MNYVTTKERDLILGRGERKGREERMCEEGEVPRAPKIKNALSKVAVSFE